MTLKTLQKIDIFISSPSDVNEERQIALRVIDRLNRMQHIASRYVLKPLAYEHIVPAAIGETLQNTVNRYMMEASKADVFICVLWSRMGTPVIEETTGERFQSGTEYEFVNAYHARQQVGKPYMLLYRGMRPIPPDGDMAQASQVQEFFRGFEGDNAEYKGLYKTYLTMGEFEETLFHDLDMVLTKDMISPDVDDLISTSGAPQNIRYDFFQHVPLPANYVPRVELLAEAKAALLAEKPNVALTSALKSTSTALHGLGGIGKSVIARALCDDPQVQAAFPDGILWTSLGQTPNLSAKLREWISALGGTFSENAPSEDSLRASLAHLLEARACLLIVDDVWQKKHVEAFRVGGLRCRMLITTRDAEVARGLGAKVQSIPTMTVSEAVQLLEEWADGSLAQASAGIKVQIASRLGRLPLALKLAGAQLQRRTPEEWLRTFDARKLKSNRPEDIHDSLEQTFGLSLDALQASERRLYVTLVIFRQDEPIHEAGIRRLWNALGDLSDDLTDEILDDLAARALLELVRKTYPRAVVLHDLLRDFVEVELGEERDHIHRTLLDAYRQSQQGQGWHTAPDDGYLYDHLCYHLTAIKAIDDLEMLFADQHWMNVRVPQCGYDYDGYLDDLRNTWDLTRAESYRQIEANQPLTSFPGCVRYALIRTSVNSIAGNYIPALMGRAVELGLWTAGRALSMAARIPDPGLRIETYVALLSKGSLSANERRRAQEAALAAARTSRTKRTERPI